MDCYGQYPLENRFGIPRYSRYSEISSISPAANGRESSPSYMIKTNSENTISSLHQDNTNSPTNFSQHNYPTTYRMSPSIPIPIPTTAPYRFYQANYDQNCSSSYLPRTPNSCSPSIDQYKDSLEKMNNGGPIDEYYRNTHYNYQQSFSNYGKLNVPKSPYFNHHHLGLPPQNSSHLPAPRPYHPKPINEYYDPIAGLHQAVRNGFKDNIGLSNTYHNIYNCSPPLTSPLKKPHFSHPYNHPSNLYPSSYSSYPSYDGKTTNFDYYRSQYPFLSSYPDYHNPNAAQYHLYQQHQHQRQLLLNKHSIQQQNLYHNGLPSPIAMAHGDAAYKYELENLQRLSEHNMRKIREIEPDRRLESLIKEELNSLSPKYERKNNLKIESKNHIDYSDDMPLEVCQNSNDKLEQRVESSASEINVGNDVNSETTAASSPLTSVSSYTDSGISGCSNCIEGSNTSSDGGSIEEKIDENQIGNHIMDADDVQNEINDKIDNTKNTELNENELKLTRKHLTESSCNFPKDTKPINEEHNHLPPDRSSKKVSDTPKNNRNNSEKSDLNYHIQNLINHNQKSHSQFHPSDIGLQRYNSQYTRTNTGNISSYPNQNQTKSKSKSSIKDEHSSNNSNNNKKNKINNNKVKKVEYISKNRVLECDFIPSKKSRMKTNFGCFPNDSFDLREEIKNIKPLPAFQQAFGSTERGKFAEIFHNNSPDSLYNSSLSYDYNSIDNNSPYPWEMSDSLEGPHYSNFYRPTSYPKYLDQMDEMEFKKENFY